jgi:hypothetical protein
LYSEYTLVYTVTGVLSCISTDVRPAGRANGE